MLAEPTLLAGLHRHDFDEAFYLVEGELTFHLDGELMTVGAGPPIGTE